MSRSCVIALLVALGVGAAGCSNFATYPPIEHTSNLAPATLPPVAGLMAEAIDYANVYYGGNREVYAINLPPGIPERAYVQVLDRLGPGSYAMTEPNQFAYHVTEARTRGMDGEVDVVFRGEDGADQLVTVYLKNNLVKGYRAVDARQWRIEVTTPGPNYVPEIPDVEPVTEEVVVVEEIQ